MEGAGWAEGEGLVHLDTTSIPLLEFSLDPLIVIHKNKSNKMLQNNLTPFFSSAFIALSDAELHFARCVAL